VRVGVGVGVGVGVCMDAELGEESGEEDPYGDDAENTAPAKKKALATKKTARVDSKKEVVAKSTSLDKKTGKSGKSVVFDLGEEEEDEDEEEEKEEEEEEEEEESGGKSDGDSDDFDGAIDEEEDEESEDGQEPEEVRKGSKSKATLAVRGEGKSAVTDSMHNESSNEEDEEDEEDDEDDKDDEDKENGGGSASKQQGGEDKGDDREQVLQKYVPPHLRAQMQKGEQSADAKLQAAVKNRLNKVLNK